MESNIITSIKYGKVERKIEFNDLKIIKTEHQMEIYNDKLTTSSHQFALNDVLDISYRSFSGPDGILYLHTNQGVFSYEISADPCEFIEIAKQYINK